MESLLPFISPIGKSKLMQFIMNLVPLLGVIFMDWSVFALIYVFWLETLGISFFNGLKIFFAQGGETSGPHFSKALTYLVFRAFVLGFYMIFILIFIGVMIGSKQGQGYEWVQYLVFSEPSFRITVLVFFFAKFFEFIYFYFVKNEREISTPEQHSSYFDVRLIVIHVVLIGGFFAYDFFSKKLGNQMGLVAFAVVFVTVKSLIDYFANGDYSIKALRKNEN
jgi:hypothetical protein